MAIVHYSNDSDKETTHETKTNLQINSSSLQDDALVPQSLNLDLSRAPTFSISRNDTPADHIRLEDNLHPVLLNYLVSSFESYTQNTVDTDFLSRTTVGIADDTRHGAGLSINMENFDLNHNVLSNPISIDFTESQLEHRPTTSFHSPNILVLRGNNVAVKYVLGEIKVKFIESLGILLILQTDGTLILADELKSKSDFICSELGYQIPILKAVFANDAKVIDGNLLDRIPVSLFKEISTDKNLRYLIDQLPTEHSSSEIKNFVDQNFHFFAGCSWQLNADSDFACLDKNLLGIIGDFYGFDQCSDQPA